MTDPWWRPAVRGLFLAGSAAFVVASVRELRLADWPIYLVYVVVSWIVAVPYVEVLPRMALPMASLATTLGFLYIAGLPVLLLRNLGDLWILHRVLPRRWRRLLPLPAPATRSEGIDLDFLADWSALTLGLGVRWWVASQLVPEGRLADHLGAIALGELAGYTYWGVTAHLPVFSFRPVTFTETFFRRRSVITDLGIVMVLALTPFVFLITYGYRVNGLAGAAGWSLAALGLHVMLKNLTERRITVERQNRELEALNRELEHRERLSAIGKMSSVVSHQILQQLGVIGIHADLLRQAEGATEQVRTNAAAIEDALGEVNRVLRDLLVFSRDLKLNVYEHPLERVVEEGVEGCRASAAERGVTVRVECPEGIAVTLDKLKVKQALANVVRNAIQASPPGGEVRVRGGQRDGWVEIAVADDGPGVPLAERDAVFTPFFTTKEQGTGLGLAIAREFTEAHGGTLALEDGTGRGGATFVLRLPLRPAASAA